MAGPGSSAYAAALHVIQTLRAAGHVGLLAGGCVRDRLLGLTPKDYDVATDAPPPRVKQLFPRARHVGAQFGVMLVRKFGHDVEVATFRADGPYTDGRHPDEVRFGTDREDARRRDFTINGMFFDPIAERIIDFVGGQEDLRAGVLRTIGDPEQRFAEDHLRLLRAVRFAARLGFTIEPRTLAAVRHLAPKLRAVSAERVWIELEAILTHANRLSGWRWMVETGLYGHVADGLFGSPGDAERAAIEARLRSLPAGPIEGSLALASLLVGRSEQQVAQIALALRLSNRLRESVRFLVAGLVRAQAAATLELADVKLLMADDDWPRLVELMDAERAAGAPDAPAYQRLSERAAEIVPHTVAPPPLLDGHVLTEVGMKPGRAMGEVLEAVYRAQLNERITTRDEALVLARQLADLPEE